MRSFNKDQIKRRIKRGNKARVRIIDENHWLYRVGPGQFFVKVWQDKNGKFYVRSKGVFNLT